MGLKGKSYRCDGNPLATVIDGLRFHSLILEAPEVMSRHSKNHIGCGDNSVMDRFGQYAITLVDFSGRCMQSQICAFKGSRVARSLKQL